MTNVTVRVSPIFDPWYYEYYYKGLVDFYGKENVKFSYSENFLRFFQFSETKFRKAFFYYEVTYGDNTKKVVISAEDWLAIHEEVYSQVDCYAKVNVVENQLVDQSKIFPIGPNFGIRYFTTLEYLFFTYRLFAKTGIKNPYLKVFFTNSLKRSFFSIFKEDKKRSILNQTFYLNYPWSKHEKVTGRRKQIIGILKRLERKGVILFEGGFSKRRFGYHQGLKDQSAKKVYNHKAYIKSVKRSGFVINTPAVHDCLGWKIGEYLALGKAIISLPLNRVMPGDFQKGVHYVEIARLEDLEEKIQNLVNDQERIKSLSVNANKYFQQFLAPEKVVERIHKKIIPENSSL